jgi:hypothetical protein
MIYNKKVSLKKQKKRNKNNAYPPKLVIYAKHCFVYVQVRRYANCDTTNNQQTNKQSYSQKNH